MRTDETDTPVVQRLIRGIAHGEFGSEAAPPELSVHRDLQSVGGSHGIHGATTASVQPSDMNQIAMPFADV